MVHIYFVTQTDPQSTGMKQLHSKWVESTHMRIVIVPRRTQHVFGCLISVLWEHTSFNSVEHDRAHPQSSSAHKRQAQGKIRSWTVNLLIGWFRFERVFLNNLFCTLIQRYFHTYKRTAHSRLHSWCWLRLMHIGVMQQPTGMKQRCYHYSAHSVT